MFNGVGNTLKDSGDFLNVFVLGKVVGGLEVAGRIGIGNSFSACVRDFVLVVKIPLEIICRLSQEEEAVTSCRRHGELQNVVWVSSLRSLWNACRVARHIFSLTRC